MSEEEGDVTLLDRGQFLTYTAFAASPFIALLYKLVRPTPPLTFLTQQLNRDATWWEVWGRAPPALRASGVASRHAAWLPPTYTPHQSADCCGGDLPRHRQYRLNSAPIGDLPRHPPRGTPVYTSWHS